MTSTAAAAALIDVAPGSPRRAEIIQVASALYRRRGLDTSLQDIAERLGVTYNALYNHFKNRDDLILHCLLWSGSILHNAIVDSDGAGGRGREKVLRFLRDFVALSTEAQTASGRLSAALSIDGRRQLYGQTVASRELLARIITDGIADGSIDDCDPLVTATWILHTLYWWPDELDEYEHLRTTEEIGATIAALVGRALAGSKRR